MSYETIVVAFDSAGRATAAIRDLRRMGVPAGDIRRHPADADTVDDVAEAVAAATSEGAGFWAWLFGESGEHRQVRLYQAALERGGTVLSVRVMEDEAVRVRAALAAHAPLDLREAG